MAHFSGTVKVTDMDAENIKLLDRFTLTVDKGEFQFQNKYGLLDDIGNEILKKEYHAIWEMTDNLIAFRYGIVFGLLNSNGDTIIEPCLEGFREFEYQGESRCSFIEDILGKESFKENEDYIIFHENITNRPLLLSQSGEIISKFEFDWLGHVFSNGRGKVILNGKAGIYNFKLKRFDVEAAYHDEELYLSDIGEIVYEQRQADRVG
ncbi:MAG: WG repeat-containing protein [Cyclobacteriaceae bacterium]|nr:MAG: WG repeat-containing protein [Cyclobacteriaceae bacterium]